MRPRASPRLESRRKRIATRGSPLARWQAHRVAQLLGDDAELVIVETMGDQRADTPIHAMGGTGVFVKEVQQAVLDGRADAGVHSAKDLPSETTPGLVIAAIPERADPRDALVGSTLDDLPAGAVVATGSVRRRAQLAAARPDLGFAELRGNMGTRLEKASGFDAIVVAAAALDRLGHTDRITQRCSTAVMLPQVAQGALAVECRDDDHATVERLHAIDDDDVHRAVNGERAFLAALGGGCDEPVAALAARRGRRCPRRGDDGDARRADRPASRDCRCERSRRRSPAGRRVAHRVRGRRMSVDPLVALVGAGPGDPGLLTRRGEALLARAEVVVYDRLAHPSLLALAPDDAERIYVGKAPDVVEMSQDDINALLVERGSAGRRVVRLKGGDPFVFGRGGEEAEALAQAGIAFEVVPGITSAIAAPAYAGIPVTHRGVSTHFTVVTGHEDPAKGSTDVDWAALARTGGTLVILMGVGNMVEIASRLVAGGRSPETPVAAVHNGTRSDQRTTRATLGTIEALAAQSPAVIVVGEVAGSTSDGSRTARCSVAPSS